VNNNVILIFHILLGGIDGGDEHFADYTTIMYK